MITRLDSHLPALLHSRVVVSSGGLLATTSALLSAAQRAIVSETRELCVVVRSLGVGWGGDPPSVQLASSTSFLVWDLVLFFWHY